MLDKRVVAVVGLVLLAGCSGAVQETTPTSTTRDTTSSVDPTTTTKSLPTTSATTPEETTTSQEKEVENPWGEQNVTVAVWNTVNQSRNVKPLVNQTLTYWNGNGSQYAEYNVTFVPTTNVYEADITVRLVAGISECGGGDTNSTVGCAPVLDAWETPTDSVEVRVVAGYSNESTRRILKHEFGHVVGLEHGEEPMPTMQAIAEHTYLSQADIADRAVPWRNSTLSVYVDVSALPGHDREDARTQIRHALDYYESGAEGSVPSNVSFVTTSNRSAADVRISFADDPFDCGGERVREGSCGLSWVYDTDTDGAPEYFADYEIKLRDLNVDAIGWHVGYWLADAMGLSGDELPEPFVDSGDGERQSDWWE
ncbi:hypothetical protein M0R89_13765 [Halorussus limi]|uniref:Matrixin n=1 Tax=Halorussus limi TaxID=2938695 RepID=A0A8U0HS08_9EURY|nr:hypothetical protein [Halorussus limi]UPV73601.1 hypothetical protein M0R89_13765 [Halorussus limi]